MAGKVGYWSLVDPVWLTLNDSWDDGPVEFLRQFRTVRPEVGNLYAAHWCHSEVCNGGLNQFFFNTTGLLAPEAVEGFQVIGVGRLAEILTDAMNFFGEPYPRDRSLRVEYLAVAEVANNKGRSPFHDLDERFFEWAGEWENAANIYAERFVGSDGTYRLQ